MPGASSFDAPWSAYHARVPSSLRLLEQAVSFSYVILDLSAPRNPLFSLQKVSSSTRRELDHLLTHYRCIPNCAPNVSESRRNVFYQVYAQTRVLHDITSGEWDPPADLRALLYERRPPLPVMRVRDEFCKCFIGNTCLKGSHARTWDYQSVVDLLSTPDDRMHHLYHMRRRWAEDLLKGGQHRLLWNNACCYVLRPEMDHSKMILPLHFNVFHPFYFPSERATPSQMLQASRIVASNEALHTTNIYSALVEGLTYLVRVTKFHEDPLSDDARPLFFKPEYAVMVDWSPGLGRSLFACVQASSLRRLPSGSPIISEGEGLAVAAGVIRPSFETGEHYGFNYFAQVDNLWGGVGLPPSNLLVTNEGRFEPAWPVGAGSPIFYANCSHDGNCYVYNVDLRDKARGVVKGSCTIYKLPILTAARDLFEGDFVKGEEAAVAAGFKPIKGVLRLPLEYLYSTKHASRSRKRGYVLCRCLSRCAGRKGGEKWYVFVDPEPKRPSDTRYDEESVRKLPIQEAHKQSIAAWIKCKRKREG